MNRAVLFGLVMLVGMTNASRANEADDKLEAFFRAYLDELFALRPLEATLLGEHRFDHLLDDISPAARRGWTDLARRRLGALPKEVSLDELSPDGKVSYEILRDELTR